MLNPWKSRTVLSSPLYQEGNQDLSTHLKPLSQAGQLLKQALAHQHAPLTWISIPLQSIDAGGGGRENLPSQKDLFLSFVTNAVKISPRFYSPELI